MFTGIIQALGEIREVEQGSGDLRLRIGTGTLDSTRLAEGDSVAVSGVCLTVVEPGPDGFSADVSAETLACTTFSEIVAGQVVNLEPALTPSTPLGGHIVTGHVDGVGHLTQREPDGRSERMEFSLPSALERFVAAKGSLCVDGISLTVNDVTGGRVGVMIVPHTLEHTTLGALQTGAAVNLEVDLLARYLERLLGVRTDSKDKPPPGITRDFLERHGFIR
ncbi:MAG: riboflavin synthase [Gammaproteobacteria bacterium]|jgi:riboflavin synthase|nr:riboflavin synthase [Gammaproteobacteria bacterium]